jgi:hypothetical protein
MAGSSIKEQGYREFIIYARIPILMRIAQGRIAIGSFTPIVGLLFQQVQAGGVDVILHLFCFKLHIAAVPPICIQRHIFSEADLNRMAIPLLAMIFNRNTSPSTWP